MESSEKYKLKKLLKRIEEIRGRGTELISVYIPADYNINVMADQLSYERSMAVNIKSKQTRKNVLTALEKILGEMKKYRKTPEKGMVIFCGNTGGERTNMEMWVIEPPERLNTKMYRCDQEFWTEPLKELITEKEEYLLVSIDRAEVAFGVLKGKAIEVVNSIESHIPGKMRAGGQSAPRFMRQREEMKISFLKDTGEKIKELMMKRQLKKIILGGPGSLKEELNDDHYLGIYTKNVVGSMDISYAGEDGFPELLEKSSDLLKKESLVDEKSRLDKFFRLLGERNSKAVYGRDETKTMLENGILEELFMSETLKDEEIEQLTLTAERFGTKVLVASTDTREGETLKQIGGIAGILRYALR